MTGQQTPVAFARTGLPSAADIWSTSSGPAATATVATATVAAPRELPAPHAPAEPRAIPAQPMIAQPSVTVEPRVVAAAPATIDPPAAPVVVPPALPATLTAVAVTMPVVATATPRAWPPRKLSLALQGGGAFSAFTWGVLDRLLEEPDCEFDVISGASGGAVNAMLLASGLVEGGREGARARLNRFWNRIITEASFRSLMILGGFSPAGSSVAFGPALRSGQFDPFDLDPLRQLLERDVDFSVLRDRACPKLLIAATRIRDGRQQVFDNTEISADVVLASTCPPMVHCSVEIDGESYWDGGYGANPPMTALVQRSETSDILVVQVTPQCDSYVPVTMAAIDRRLDQITANSALNAEIDALEWAAGLTASLQALRICRIAAEDGIEGLAQRSAVDLGRGFITQLFRSGRAGAERWLKATPAEMPPASTVLPGKVQPAAATRRNISAPDLQPLMAEPEPA
jgi:NTE family protein